MKILLKSSLPLILIAGLITSCGNISKQVDEKLNQISTKVEHLDSIVNREVDKVKDLDTLINLESDKIKKLDTLINETSTKIDSITNAMIEPVNIPNY